MSVTAQKIADAAMHYLQRYGSSTENLRRVLQRRMKRRQMKFNDVPPEAAQWIDQAVEKCVRLKLVDDVLYAEARVISLRRQGRSKNYIIQNLTQKGVEKKTILQFFGDDDEDEIQAAKRYAAKKRLGLKTDREQQQKDLAKMLRAGFSMRIARDALTSTVETDESFD